MTSQLANGTGVHAVAQTCDDSADDHLWDAESSALESSANAQDDTSEHNTLASTKLLTQDQTEDGAEEASNLVDGNDCILKGGATACTSSRVDLRKGSCEGISSQQARHDSLVCHVVSCWPCLRDVPSPTITEEEEARAGRGRNGPIKSTSGKDSHDEDVEGSTEAATKTIGNGLMQLYQGGSIKIYTSSSKTSLRTSRILQVPPRLRLLRRLASPS